MSVDPVVSAIWLCGREQLASLRAVVQAERERVPVTVLALDSDTADFLRDALPTGSSLSWLPAYDSDACAVALNIAIRSSPAAYMQLRLAHFEYHAATFQLLAEQAANCRSEIITFDYTLKFQSCHWLRGATMLRSHGEKPWAEPNDPESHWCDRNFLQANLARITRLVPTRGFVRLLFDELLQVCQSRMCSRLIAGSVERISAHRCAFETPPVFVARHFENWFSAGQAAANNPNGTEASLQRVVEIAKIAQLTWVLSPAAQRFAELNIEMALGQEWGKVSAEIENDAKMGQVLDITLVDLLDVVSFTTLDMDFADAASLARNRILEEIAREGVSSFAKAITGVVLRGHVKSDAPASEQQIAHRWESLRLRMEYAKVLHSLKLARIQNQKLARNNRELTGRHSVYQRAQKSP